MAEKKTTIDILNEIRDLRNQELIKQKDNRVFYTTIMALEKGNTGKQIYRMMEEFSIGENESLVRELFYIYKDKPELIAVIDSEKYEGIYQIDGKEEKTEEEKSDWDLLVKDIEEGRAKADEKIKETALNLGINQKEIEGLSEIDVEKRVYSKINEINKQNDNKAKKIEENKEDKEDEVPFSISNQEAKKYGIIGMNTMLLNQKVGVHGETLKQELGLDGREQYADVDSIEIIPAYKLSALGCKVPDTPFVAVARHRDGSIEAFPESICKIYKGANNDITKIDGQKDEANTEKADTIMQFAGKNASIAINQKSPYGIAEASLAYNTRDNNGRVALTLQDKYDGTDQNDYDARNIVNQRQGTEHNRKVVNEGKEHPGEIAKREDADGNRNTADHIHENSIVNYEGREANFKVLAMSIGGCSNEQEVNELLEKTNAKLNDDKDLNVEQAVKQAINERNNEIIEQTKEPEKVKQLMESAKISDPREAINILEANNWDLEESEEQCEEQYRNKSEET
ncbi:MAG: hypothetical protein ILA02_03450 [Clostridia bacterium]|nr:hypothetical protein [Clostridia bacterium]